jgi:hypothetical protein
MWYDDKAMHTRTWSRFPVSMRNLDRHGTNACMRKYVVVCLRIYTDERLTRAHLYLSVASKFEPHNPKTQINSFSPWYLVSRS